jgi:hypothetical protein
MEEDAVPEIGEPLKISIRDIEQVYTIAMRTFTDSEGHIWEAAAAFGSFGAVQLIFSRQNGKELRSCGMQAETLHDAQQELAACSEDALRERLHNAEPWK